MAANPESVSATAWNPHLIAIRRENSMPAFGTEHPRSTFQLSTHTHTHAPYVIIPTNVLKENKLRKIAL